MGTIPDNHEHPLPQAVSEALRTMREAEEALDETREALGLAKERLNYVVETTEIDPEGLALLYWYVDEVKVKTIAQKMGGSTNGLARRLPWQMGWTFTNCGHFVAATSRTDLSTNHRRCTTCADEARPAIEAARRDQEEAAAARLQEMRTMPYGEYLKTEHWKQVRQGALRRAGYACQTCAARVNLNVHHRDYERRGQERANDVVALCRSCHGRTHHKIDAGGVIESFTQPIDAEIFLEEWRSRFGDDEHSPTEELAVNSLSQWRRAGVRLGDLREAMDITEAKTLDGSARYRYFCGVVWRSIDTGKFGLAFAADEDE